MNDNIRLKKIKSSQEKKLFVDYKLKLVKLHQKYATTLKIFDQVVENYDDIAAMRHFNEKGYFQFLIKKEDEVIGILEYQITISDIDNKEIVYIKKFYINEEYQGKGYGKKVIEILKKIGCRIELECWYEMPANNIYKAFGMRQIKTRYMLNEEIEKNKEL